MSTNTLSMRRFEPNELAIDIALPVLAIECEATPPIENSLDAYEEAVLKLVALGLSTRGIANSLYSTESLIDDILSRLEAKKYTMRKKGQPWIITDDGHEFINGTLDERKSNESQYGFMFVNALKKEILPYFHVGDIGKIPLVQGANQSMRLTAEGGESLTFIPVEIKRARLNSAYKAFNYISENHEKFENGEISHEEEIDLFPNLSSFDEEAEETIESASTEQTEKHALRKNMFIRALQRKQINAYLYMRIILDPNYPGGYRVQSPFDLGDADKNYFLEQVQWIERSESAHINGEQFSAFLTREIRKISPSFAPSAKDYSVFLVEKMPQLNISKVSFSRVYDKMKQIYSMMQQSGISLIQKENIVSSVSRYVLEAIQNHYFHAIDKHTLWQIQIKASDESDYLDFDYYKEQLCTYCGMNPAEIGWLKKSPFIAITKRLSYTYGNSSIEKFINMLLIEYYLGDIRIHRYLTTIDINQTYQTMDRLNQIRRKVSHDTDNPFTSEDYEYYMSKVFSIVNDLLNTLQED